MVERVEGWGDDGEVVVDEWAGWGGGRVEVGDMISSSCSEGVVWLVFHFILWFAAEVVSPVDRSAEPFKYLNILFLFQSPSQPQSQLRSKGLTHFRGGVMT